MPKNLPSGKILDPPLTMHELHSAVRLKITSVCEFSVDFVLLCFQLRRRRRQMLRITTTRQGAISRGKTLWTQQRSRKTRLGWIHQVSLRDPHQANVLLILTLLTEKVVIDFPFFQNNLTVFWIGAASPGKPSTVSKNLTTGNRSVPAGGSVGRRSTISYDAKASSNEKTNVAGETPRWEFLII